MSRPVDYDVPYLQGTGVCNSLRCLDISNLQCVLNGNSYILQVSLMSLWFFDYRIYQNSIPRRLPSIFGIFTRSFKYLEAALSRRCDKMHFNVSTLWQDLGMLPVDLACLTPKTPSIASASTFVGMLMVWMTSCTGAALLESFSTGTPCPSAWKSACVQRYRVL